VEGLAAVSEQYLAVTGGRQVEIWQLGARVGRAREQK
jgi:hypothetical protein